MPQSTDPTESAKHKRFIELLAEETKQPVEKVEPLYELVLDELEGKAAIVDFVPVFAWRKIRILLMQQR